MDLTLRGYRIQFCMKLINNTVSFMALLVNWYNNRLLPFLRQLFLLQTELIGLWISDSTVSAWISSAGILSLPDDLYFFNFAIAISISDLIGSGTNGSAVCISICLTPLTLCTFNSWDKQSFDPFKILWESASRSSFSSFNKLILYW
jgi:hypothetical protein